MMIFFADAKPLKFLDKDASLPKIMDLSMLSDIVPTDVADAFIESASQVRSAIR